METGSWLFVNSWWAEQGTGSGFQKIAMRAGGGVGGARGRTTIEKILRVIDLTVRTGDVRGTNPPPLTEVHVRFKHKYQIQVHPRPHEAKRQITVHQYTGENKYGRITHALAPSSAYIQIENQLMFGSMVDTPDGGSDKDTFGYPKKKETRKAFQRHFRQSCCQLPSLESISNKFGVVARAAVPTRGVPMAAPFGCLPPRDGQFLIPQRGSYPELLPVCPKSVLNRKVPLPPARPGKCPSFKHPGVPV